MFTSEQVDAYFQQAGCVTWGKGFDISQPDTRKLAVDWFLKQIEKIKEFNNNPNLNLEKPITLYTPTGGMRVLTNVKAIVEGVAEGYYGNGPYIQIYLKEFGLKLEPTDKEISSLEELRWYLTNNDTLEVCRA